ncbi:DNA-binding transcriptional regulator, GntR family [Faunimonas pinastri]|uniref:DNA-binding transcriptional regulator, GntR family n=1 Tax=Faunimonas pinastri TaxID=1855383 RepID=A0A1H9NCY1_9HYPH|nr:FCD domain-containing protein [Faunimonas pinastri]SER33565.1 DNA-binding transcriptional regulator, GntR family [Faunimonas pinastri]
MKREQLIAVQGRRSPLVARLTAKQAVEIYEVHATFESLLIRRFTEKASPTEMAELRAIFTAVREAASRDAVDEIVPLMRRFNDHLVGVVDHELIRDLLRQLDARINWLRVRAMARPGRLSASMEEIGAVLAAVERGDAEAAVNAMAHSSTNARDAAVEQLRLEDQQSPGRQPEGATRRRLRNSVTAA